MESTQFPLSTDSSTVDKFGHYQDLVVGCLLAVCGNLLISISLNIQKFTHVRNEERLDSIHYTKDPLWWMGLVLMVLGEIGNFSAYGFAPASVVAPLGTTTVIANLFLAAAFLKEKIRAENLFGTAMAIIGAFLVVTFSAKNERVMNGHELNQAVTNTSFIVYTSIEVVVLVVLFVLLYKMEVKHVIVYLLITSVIASFTVIAAKAVSSLLQLSVSGYSQMGYPILYAMALLMFFTAVIQVKYLNEAMKNFDSTVVVPTNFVFFTISAIMAGIIFYKEFWGMNALEICMFLVGCLMSFVGVYFITMNKRFTQETEEPILPSDASTEDKAVLTPNIFPSWLLASVNVGEVQPKGEEVRHLTDNDRAPFLSPLPEESSTSQDSLYSRDDSPVGATAAPSYGATG